MTKSTIYIVVGLLLAGALGYFLACYICKKNCNCPDEPVQEITETGPPN